MLWGRWGVSQLPYSKSQPVAGTERQTTIHIHIEGQSPVGSPVNLTPTNCMSLDGGRKLEYPRKHEDNMETSHRKAPDRWWG